LLLVPYWPAGCAAPKGTGATVASTPSTIEPAKSDTPVSFLPHPAFALADSGSRVSIADIAERVTKSVVSVSSEREAEQPPAMGFPFFFQMPHPGPVHGLGSGVIVSKDIVLTNNHVVEKSDQIRVSASDGREFSAELVGADEKSDLAVLRLKGDVEGLQPLGFGDSSRLRLGDVVLAIGNPFGVGQTVTMGIVSAKGRTDVGIEAYEDFIQTDAAINPGNSGGALVDMEGNLVGINTAILSRSGGYQGIGFAIPSSMAKPIMQALIDHGKVVRGFLGVGIQDLSPDLKQAMGLKDIDGVLISSVEPGGAAERAGIKQGDVITRVDGEAMETTGHLRNAIAMKGASKSVEIELRRGSDTKKFSVKLGELPDNSPKTGSKAPQQGGGLGLELAPLTPELAQRFGSDLKQGVVVVGVVPGSPAASAGLQPGDILLQVGKKKVKTPAEVKAALPSGKSTVLLLVQRGGGTRYVAVKR
jgi:serine protease Do